MAAPPFKFTSHDLNSSIEVAKVVEEHGGLASQDELAQWLGYKSKNNGAFLSRVASARAFGLLTGSPGIHEASPRAIDILRPDYPATEQRARLEAFESVALYKAVLEYYHGQPLPDTKGLRNALETRWGIHTDRSVGVMSRLLDSAEQAGLFAAAGGRTRMIRPSISENGARPATSPTPMSVPMAGSSVSSPPPVLSNDARHHKVIDGVLDMLPSTESPWKEVELAQWLNFFESALRVVYRVPKSTDERVTSGRSE